MNKQILKIASYYTRDLQGNYVPAWTRLCVTLCLPQGKKQQQHGSKIRFQKNIKINYIFWHVDISSRKLLYLFVGLTAATKARVFFFFLSFPCPELLLLVTVEGRWNATLRKMTHTWKQILMGLLLKRVLIDHRLIRLNLCNAFRGTKTNKAKAALQNISLMGVIPECRAAGQTRTPFSTRKVNW